MSTATRLERVTISLPKPANEMVQEEIVKRVHHLSKAVANARFEDGGRVLVFEAPADETPTLRDRATTIAQRVQQSLPIEEIFPAVGTGRLLLSGFLGDSSSKFWGFYSEDGATTGSLFLGDSLAPATSSTVQLGYVPVAALSPVAA